MPHQCVKCSTLYEDGASEIMTGCRCGGKLFFFIKKGNIDKIKAMTASLSEDEKKEIENDVYEIIGREREEPVILDLETIRILQPGKYEIDLMHLFKKEPLIYRIGEGKYIIDIIQSFSNLRKK